MKKAPAVSVIMPSLNVGEYIQECLESVVAQTLREIEILCVDAGSTDGTLEIIESFAAKDPRIKIIRSPVKSYGAQMNMGMDAATGEYIGIVETDDLVAPEMFEKLYQAATQHDCEMVKADFTHFTGQWGVNASTTPKAVCNDPSAYNVILNPRTDKHAIQFSTIWTGIYKKTFLTSNGIRFNESAGASYQDVGFYLQTHFCVRRLLFLKENFYRYRRDRAESSINSKGKVFIVCDELLFARKMLEREGVFTRFQALYGRELFYAYWSAYHRVGGEYKLPFLERFSKDLRALYKENDGFLNELSPVNQSRIFSIMLSPKTFLATTNEAWQVWAKEEVAKAKPKIVVSLTSYGERVGTVHAVIRTLLHQTHRPDKIVLYLSNKEFRSKGDLPRSLRKIRSPFFEVRFVEDLRSHKKYFYAFQEFPDAIIITVDDDIEYPKNLVEELLASYRRHPYAVSAARTHTIGMRQDGSYASYLEWMRVPKIVNRPSMLVMPTSGAGALYPPHSFGDALFDWKTIRKTCLTADDLWLKWHLLEAGVPCIYVPGLWTGKSIARTQKNSLYNVNVNQTGGRSQNDVCWEAILHARARQARFITFLLAKAYQMERRLPKLAAQTMFPPSDRWLLRKIRGGIQCLRENGMRYTIRHFWEKVHAFLSRQRMRGGFLRRKVVGLALCLQENGLFYTIVRGIKQLTRIGLHDAIVAQEGGVKISVVIPVFNAEHDLRECLDSVLSQTLREIEVLCVDDGSTDASLSILQEYAARDSRVKVTHQDNHGVAYARNVALKMATGRFIAFMDPDDLYPSADALESLYKEAVWRNLKIVGGGVERFSPDNPTKLVRPPSVNTKRAGVYVYPESPFDYGYVRFIYDRAMLDRYGIDFPPYARYQDPPFFVRAMMAAKRYYVFEKPVYRYRFVPGHVDWLANDFRRLRHCFLGMRDVALLARKHGLPTLVKGFPSRLIVDYHDILAPHIEKVREFPEFKALLKALPKPAAEEIRGVYGI